MAFSWFSKQWGQPAVVSQHQMRPHPDSDPEILLHFERINLESFDGFLEAPVLRWNSRLRSAAGRFIPGSRRYPMERPPVIEVASYLKQVENSENHIIDTIAHEMIHYWLWVRRRSYGHSPEFHQKMKLMGVSRYNPVPRSQPFKYAYACPSCQKEFFSRRRLGVLACAPCCRAHSRGLFDSRFLLGLARKLTPAEGTKLIEQALTKSR